MSKVPLGDYQSRTVFIGVYAESVHADNPVVRVASIKRQLRKIAGIAKLYHRPAAESNAVVERVAVIFRSVEAKENAAARLLTAVQSEGGYILKPQGIKKLPQYYIKALNRYVGT